jgi:hypothetical protein
MQDFLLHATLRFARQPDKIHLPVQRWATQGRIRATP